ncbi:MAG: hypothetical protein JW984_06915 [Deltaproteobacteria bacterium]|uniref:Uncharacterized protein n=1 Tax=Candidatus Zymogenus saltonus TaxID=2844893 RepID=A0A9D8PP79_9DELT|nr:hypothetical protein [Candidatus Zymogenus saltonus]
MKKISMFLLILFSIASLLMFTGCKASEEVTEPTDEAVTEETTPSEEVTPSEEATPPAETETETEAE